MPAVEEKSGTGNGDGSAVTRPAQDRLNAVRQATVRLSVYGEDGKH